jgi:hypothetical protein
VYSRQMMEHVVEQIDKLYWESGTRDIDEEHDASTERSDDAHVIYQNDDLTQDKLIAKLPMLWDTSADATPRTGDVDQDNYLASVSRLQGLSAQRQTLQNKLNTYKTLLSLLEPYRKPKENIQPNLVWRDSPLAPELMKTRTLAIRVAGRVGVPATAEVDEEDEDIDMDGLQDVGKRKVEKVLASW